MRPLSHPLTPVPASIATNVFLCASPPTRCCTAFLKCPKDGTPGKSDGKTYVSVSKCKKVSTYDCVFSVPGYMFPSLSPSICAPVLLFILPKWSVIHVELCMDRVHGFPLLTVTLTTVSISRDTDTAIQSDITIPTVRLFKLVFFFACCFSLPSQKLVFEQCILYVNVCGVKMQYYHEFHTTGSLRWLSHPHLHFLIWTKDTSPFYFWENIWLQCKWNHRKSIRKSLLIYLRLALITFLQWAFASKLGKKMCKATVYSKNIRTANPAYLFLLYSEEHFTVDTLKTINTSVQKPEF